MQSTVMDYPGDMSQDMLGLGVTTSPPPASSTATTSRSTPPRATRPGTQDRHGHLAGHRQLRRPARHHLRHRAPPAARARRHPLLAAPEQLRPHHRLHRVDPPTRPPGWNEASTASGIRSSTGTIVTVDGRSTQVPSAAGRLRRLQRSSAAPTAAEATAAPTAAAPASIRSSRAARPLRVRHRPLGRHSATSRSSVTTTAPTRTSRCEFLIRTQENRHIFDNYRRNRTTFSMLGAAAPLVQPLQREAAWHRRAASASSSIYKDFAADQGYAFDTLWPYIVGLQTARQHDRGDGRVRSLRARAGRPEPGAHYQRSSRPSRPGAPLGHRSRRRRSADARIARADATRHPERRHGLPARRRLRRPPARERARRRPTATTTSSTSRTPAPTTTRSTPRSCSPSRRIASSASRARTSTTPASAPSGMADVVPDGFRRVIANALTGDRSLLAPRVAATPPGSRSSTPARRPPPIRWQDRYPSAAARLDQLLAERRPGDSALRPRAATPAPTTRATAASIPPTPAATVGGRSADRLGGAEVPDRLDRRLHQGERADQLDRHDADLAARPERHARLQPAHRMAGPDLGRDSTTRATTEPSACSATRRAAARAARSSRKGSPRACSSTRTSSPPRATSWTWWVSRPRAAAPPASTRSAGRWSCTTRTGCRSCGGSGDPKHHARRIDRPGAGLRPERRSGLHAAVDRSEPLGARAGRLQVRPRLPLAGRAGLRLVRRAGSAGDVLTRWTSSRPSATRTTPRFASKPRSSA